jgi:hypothetical protein
MTLTTRNFIEWETDVPAGTTIQAPLIGRSPIGGPLVVGVSISSDVAAAPTSGNVFFKILSGSQIVLPGNSLPPSSGNAPGGWAAVGLAAEYNILMAIPGPDWSVEFQFANYAALAQHIHIRVYYATETIETLLLKVVMELQTIKNFINELRK